MPSAAVRTVVWWTTVGASIGCLLSATPSPLAQPRIMREASTAQLAAAHTEVRFRSRFRVSLELPATSDGVATRGNTLGGGSEA